MKPPFPWLAPAAMLATVAVTAPVDAAIPPAVEAMIREAARSGDVVIPTPPAASWLAAQQTAGMLPSPLDGWALSGGGAAIGSPCGSDGGGFSQAAGHFQEVKCGISRRVTVEHRSYAPSRGESITC